MSEYECDYSIALIVSPFRLFIFASTALWLLAIDLIQLDIKFFRFSLKESGEKPFANSRKLRASCGFQEESALVIAAIALSKSRYLNFSGTIPSAFAHLNYALQE